MFLTACNLNNKWYNKNMREDIRKKIKQKVYDLPTCPGVYKMLDENNNIIYIGKAKNLKNRVSSYFINTDKPEKVKQMVEHIFDFEYIVVKTELDALTLESNLIHLHQPFYNILLKDGKAFPYIRINKKEKYPRVEIVRKVKNDGASYYGPYFAKININSLYQIINNTFKLRDCNYNLDNKKLDRECLQYHIENCLAPCTGKVNAEEYRKEVDRVVDFLNGDLSYAKRVLENKMKVCSSLQQYEKAMEYRDDLKQIEYLNSLILTELTRLIDLDAFAMFERNNEKVVSVLIVRGGKTVGVSNFKLDDVSENNDSYLNFIIQYYMAENHIPTDIIVQDCDKNLLECYLQNKFNSKVNVSVSKIGIKKKLLDVAFDNAKEYYDKSIEKSERKRIAIENTLEDLKNKLNLRYLPVRIEGYDISNLQGTNTVASMVVFEQGVPNKKHYRKFKIDRNGQNDFDSMRQVITRRIHEYNLGRDVSFSKRPNLILIDGGIGQLGYANNVLKEFDFDCDIASLAKRLEEVYKPDSNIPIIISKRENALKLLQNVRDESHRFAITFQRSLRQKKNLTSALENIPLISKKKSIELIKHFKSIDKIKQANLSELMQVDGIGMKLAKNIYEYFHND